MPQTPIQEYINQVQKLYKEGRATEHSYRPALKQLLESLVNAITVTNEPKRISCGAPDYIITSNNDLPIGYIEAKDVNVNLTETENSEQLKRYRASLDNLILTDYLEFRWFQKGEKVAHIRIGHVANGVVKPAPEQYPHFTDLIREFAGYRGQPITNAETLAKMMAAKARMMHHVLETALTQDEADTLNPDTSLQEQYKAFQNILIHDISKSEFSDIYSQTIAYGMFAARMHDTTPDDFTREKAAKLIPGSNPFLRKLFQFIAGYDLDTRLSWIVDTLADVFRATDIETVLKNFGKSTQQNDPVIHFYETFLKEYNPALRKSRGVWYTPEPVVNFIVRAVDDILKTEFDLKDGLADTSKVTVEVKTQTPDKNFKEGYKRQKVDFHKVQILDPATGTGTFLAEVIKQIYKGFEGQQGIWSNYVDEHLIPRVNGFEILMASYAMAHLKLEKLLNDTGHKPKIDQRLRVFLTNSLEEAHPDTGTLFAQWLSTEANEANRVKRDTPVMVVLGNPPYSVSSNNKSEWIEKLMVDYKKNLNEKNIQPLSDDYLKFIRFGQYFVDKNGEGILAYISNNSFIDGVTHRQMRKNLLETFDKIYILDLHGSTKKNETTEGGKKDENVFDIQQGVSINLFIKTKEKKKGKLGEVKHFDLLGLREDKYKALLGNDIAQIQWNKLNYSEPYYFFAPKDFSSNDSYVKGFEIAKLIKYNACGVVTARDNITVRLSQREIEILQSDFKDLPENEFREKYDEHKDSRDWKYSCAKDDIDNSSIQRVDYRPFDKRYILYSPNSKGVLSYPRNEIMKHMIVSDNNFGLLICKQQSTFDFQHIFITKVISDKCTVSLQTKEASYHFPLYLYTDKSAQQNLHNEGERKPNLNTEIVAQIGRGLKLSFVPEQINEKSTFAPIDILDYIYAILHSPAYREKYKEFLKIDFPRVPYPTNTGKFWQLVKLGGELRQIHLLESPVVSKFITTYPIAGDNTVSKIKFDAGKVWINETQYFDKVPAIAYEFYIGGYQPAQKWLKDRKERTLTYDDITHYQKIIVALTETARIMGEVDKVGVE